MRNFIKYSLCLVFATFVAGLGLTSAASAKRSADVSRDPEFYECTPEFEGFVIRYAVGSRPDQVVYVYVCDGSGWVLIDIER
jgi:hypothetical protein